MVALDFVKTDMHLGFQCCAWQLTGVIASMSHKKDPRHFSCLYLSNMRSWILIILSGLFPRKQTIKNGITSCLAWLVYLHYLAKLEIRKLHLFTSTVNKNTNINLYSPRNGSNTKTQQHKHKTKRKQRPSLSKVMTLGTEV